MTYLQKEKEKKSGDVQISLQNQVKSKKGHHVRRCPVFRAI